MALGQRLFITMFQGAGRVQGTLQALVFLGVLVGMVVPSPAGARANGTLLDSRGWGTLLSRSRAGLAGEISGVNWESGYLVGIKRQRRLYCNVGIGFHLQVPPDGRISGTHEENPYSLLEISTVERGVVSLFGVKSTLFIAMNSKGRLYTTPSFQEECRFRETLLPNNYNAYESDLYRGTYIALSKYGRVKRGSKNFKPTCLEEESKTLAATSFPLRFEAHGAAQTLTRGFINCPCLPFMVCRGKKEELQNPWMEQARHSSTADMRISEDRHQSGETESSSLDRWILATRNADEREPHN
ncbi:fibroblast growth factor 6 [Sigmodon hispidus]